MKGTCNYFVLCQVPSRFSLSFVPRYTQFLGLGKKNSYLLVLIYFKLHTKSCSPLVSWLACVASTSGSVWFGSKERGTRVTDPQKMGRAKELGIVPFFARPNPKIPFLVVPALFRNHTEALATQAISWVPIPLATAACSWFFTFISLKPSMKWFVK